MKPVIVFDFDKTLTYKDTILDFFIFCSKKNFLLCLRLLFYFFLTILLKFRVINNGLIKELGIKLFVSHLKSEELELLCKDFSKGIKLNKIYYNDFLKNHPDSIIVSSSFIEYLKFIFPNNLVIASKIKFKENKPVGLSFNCYGIEKRVKLNEIGIKNIDVLYTDSISDLSIVKISKKIFLVKCDSLVLCRTTEEFLEQLKNM
jgi:phosphoserine phosphatase